MSFDKNIPAWIRGDGPESDIVISTRARLARSLTHYLFPSRASGEDLSMVVQKVRSASVGLTKKFPELITLNIEKLKKEEKNFLLDAHIGSVEQIFGGKGRAVILEPSATLSIMINEEDHLRIQSVMSGFVPEKAWELADWADDVLSKKLDYGFSERYGYLTASVSNVGTGLRISTMMHLAGLAQKKRLNVKLRAAYDLGVSIRGLYGEGTKAMGNIFQVSNEVTLGISEKEIVERVRCIAEYLLREERIARRELLSKDRHRLMDNTAEILYKIRSSEEITSQQAIKWMSQLRLAESLGILNNSSKSLFNELLVGMRVGAGEVESVNIERAKLLRNKLSDAHITAG